LFFDLFIYAYSLPMLMASDLRIGDVLLTHKYSCLEW